MYKDICGVNLPFLALSICEIQYLHFYFSPMKTKILLFSLFFFLFSLANAEGTFYLVTAYYSPEPGQDFYLHDTYEDEIKMNGSGTTTASGKPVVMGSVAAPKDVAFGTRVHINQKITIKNVPYTFEFHGTVTDRGGAIHSASKLPRLDIYVGKGQKGLCRAINFGVQTVYVEFDKDTSEPDTGSIDFLSTDCKNPHNQTVPVASGVKKAFDPFTMTITAASPAENIKIVQELLKKAGSYKGDIDGIYGQAMIEAIYQFQKENDIVTSRNDDGAGLYGPKTRSTLKSLVGDSYKPAATTSTSTLIAPGRSATRTRSTAVGFARPSPRCRRASFVARACCTWSSSPRWPTSSNWSGRVGRSFAARRGCLRIA